eukprot:Blabericola_migrator_1__7873@NODE_4028_length_1374_cov_12_572303_g2481_i0_p1_GENE_NODE_4028_length_1374_cov_12_572303_g2481_i0NODE_4028_length_1374_cov_12_572303_g2481_i0_p1_ORF_typecomplete_len133_score19_06MH2/PF03166_14/0_018_NODE_4028_length_1374_cov_12_572303_g2481_i063461
MMASFSELCQATFLVESDQYSRSSVQRRNVSPLLKEGFSQASPSGRVLHEQQSDSPTFVTRSYPLSLSMRHIPSVSDTPATTLHGFDTTWLQQNMRDRNVYVMSSFVRISSVSCDEGTATPVRDIQLTPSNI